jgi:uncharacterized tellurite resistance protein B-like protein
METIKFDELLLRTAFCCMASDGNIDNREISLIKSMCEQSPWFTNFKFQEEINMLVSEINNNGRSFIQNYFDILKETQLTEEEELTLIDFAIKTINADEQVEYSEIKFFKNIRHRLKVSDDKILEHFPDIELYLEQDIISVGFLDKITIQYFEATELPQFDLINTVENSHDDPK